ncbi:MAG: hypothetical protein ACREYC_24575 [Gammaproteobacteria bacterium]
MSPQSLTTPDPASQLDQMLEACHRVNQALPGLVLGREELIALAGLLTQVSSALVRTTEVLAVSVQYQDRVRRGRAVPATPALWNCRDGYQTAYRSARDLHAGLKRRVDAG